MNRRLPQFLRRGDTPPSPETKPTSSEPPQEGAPEGDSAGATGQAPPMPPVPPIPSSPATDADPVTTMWTVRPSSPPIKPEADDPGDDVPSEATADPVQADTAGPTGVDADRDDENAVSTDPVDADAVEQPDADAGDETAAPLDTGSAVPPGGPEDNERHLPGDHGRADTDAVAGEPPSVLPDSAPANPPETSIWTVPTPAASSEPPPADAPAAGEDTAVLPAVVAAGPQPTVTQNPVAPGSDGLFGVPDAAPHTAAPATALPADVAPQTADGPSYRDRSRFRRRLRYLRRVRELGFRDLGGLVFDLYRFERSGEDLVRAKLVALEAVDRELRALERVMKDERAFTDLREPGIAACTRCGALHGSDARFCPSCGVSVSGPTTLSEVPVAASAAPTGAAGPVPTSAGSGPVPSGDGPAAATDPVEPDAR